MEDESKKNEAAEKKKQAAEQKKLEKAQERKEAQEKQKAEKKHEKEKNDNLKKEQRKSNQAWHMLCPNQLYILYLGLVCCTVKSVRIWLSSMI